MTVIPHGVTESGWQQDLLTTEVWKKTKRGMKRWCKNKSWQQLVLQASHLHGIGNKKNRQVTRYRGNHLEDNADGEGERKPRGNKRGMDK